MDIWLDVKQDNKVCYSVNTTLIKELYKREMNLDINIEGDPEQFLRSLGNLPLDWEENSKSYHFVRKELPKQNVVSSDKSQNKKQTQPHRSSATKRGHRQ